MPIHKSTLAHQQTSLLSANNHREPWQPHEIELLLEEGSIAEQAELLGRTYYAVENARYLLAQGVALGGGRGTHQTVAPKVCPCHSLQALPTGACSLS